MKRYAKYIIALWAGLVLLVPGISLAQTNERIVNFESIIKVTKQNVVEVTETIAYDFGPVERHGIFRYVPIEYSDDKGSKYYISAKMVNVSDGQGISVPVSTSKTNSNYVMKIGDPDKTISGLNTYKIQYQLQPLVRQEGDKGFLAINITGNGWNVPIEQASATISFEDEASLLEPKCFIGTIGSTEGCIIQESFPPKYTAKGLQPGEGLTVQGLLPAGYVSNYLIADQKPPLTFEDFVPYIVGSMIALGSGFVGLIFLLRHFRKRMRQKAQTIVAQYESPDSLSPAEIGLLNDDVSNTVEITATLIDLAVRGYIRIEQTSAKKWYTKAKYKFYLIKQYDELKHYEKKLLDTIFGGHKYDIQKLEENIVALPPEDEALGEAFKKIKDQLKDHDSKYLAAVELERLDKTAMSMTLTSIHSELKDELKKKGFYGSLSSEPGVVEKLLDTDNITDAGAKEWAKVQGLKLYLGVAEKDRLNFTDAPERTPEIFNKLLPYAVALGVEKEWAKQFENMDLSTSSGGWYNGGTSHLSSTALASGIGTSFASSFSNNTTVSSSSSGGSSGGGFGGGGGGSW